MFPFGPDYYGHGPNPPGGEATDASLSAKAPDGQTLPPLSVDGTSNMSESGRPPDTPVGPEALGGGTATRKRRGCLLNLLLVLPAVFWLLFLLVLLPAHQGAVVSLEQRRLAVAVSVLVSTLTIPALAFTMGGWRVLYTVPLWAGILFGTVMACRQPYFTPLDRVFRDIGQEEKAACHALIALGANIWPNSQGQIDAVDFHDLRATDDRLRSLAALPNLTHLTMNGPGVTDTALANLRGADKLESVELVGTQVSDAGLIHLEGLTRLRELDLSDTRVTDGGLECLKGLLELEKLGLDRTQVTDGGLQHVKSFTQLRELDLNRTKVTDAGLGLVKSLGQLQHLYLSGNQVSDAGLEHLKGLTQLQSLALRESHVTDAGLKHLKGLTRLQALWLNHTRVTDSGLEHLNGLSQLRIVFLDGSGVTDAGVKKLQQALPNCEIRQLD